MKGNPHLRDVLQNLDFALPKLLICLIAGSGSSAADSRHILRHIADGEHRITALAL
jgi:hypothetical protein